MTDLTHEEVEDLRAEFARSVDRALLGEAFRKVLTSRAEAHYVSADTYPHGYVTLDSTWTAKDGLTPEEFAAIERAIPSEPYVPPPPVGPRGIGPRL